MKLQDLKETTMIPRDEMMDFFDEVAPYAKDEQAFGDKFVERFGDRVPPEHLAKELEVCWDWFLRYHLY